MSKPTLSNPAIPLDSLVLVTGANGLVASNVTDQFLAAGYRVRGSVRDRAKHSWLEAIFATRHGGGRFELVEIPDLAASGAWVEALRGVSGVAHVLGALDERNPSSDDAARAEIPWQISLLEAANNEKGVRSFVFTSSLWAASTPDATKKTKLVEWSWNEAAVDLARSGKTPEEIGLLTPWMALKVLVEQAVWKWVVWQREYGRLSFTFNSVLLDTVIGYSPHPKEIGTPSTSGMVKWVYDGTNLHLLALMQPQWYVNSCDAAMLYVAALTTPGVDGERIYACAGRYSWPRVLQILKEIYPEKACMPGLDDNGWDQTDIPNQRAETLLRRVKKASWASLTESVEAAAQCFVSSATDNMHLCSNHIPFA